MWAAFTNAEREDPLPQSPFHQKQNGASCREVFWSWDKHLGSEHAVFRLLLRDRDVGLRRGRCWDGLSSNEVLAQSRCRLKRHSTVALWQRKARERYLPLLSWFAGSLFSGLIPLQRYDPDWSETDSGFEQGTKAGYRQPDEPLRLSQGFVSKGTDTAGPHCAAVKEVVIFALELRKWGHWGGSQGHKHKLAYSMVRYTVNWVEKYGGGKKNNRNAIVKWASDL